MSQKTNVTIDKVFRNERQGKNGPFFVYDVYFEGDEDRYSFFEKKDHLNPEVGMIVSFLKFDVKQNGKFINRTITALEFAKGQQPKQQTQNPQPTGPVQKTNGNNKLQPDPLNFYLRYMADVKIAQIKVSASISAHQSGAKLFSSPLKEFAEEIAIAALTMKKIIEEKKEEPKKTNGKGFLDYMEELKRQLAPDTYNLIVKDMDLTKLDKVQQEQYFNDCRAALKEQIVRESAPVEEENIPF